MGCFPRILMRGNQWANYLWWLTFLRIFLKLKIRQWAYYIWWLTFLTIFILLKIRHCGSVPNVRVIHLMCDNIIRDDSYINCLAPNIRVFWAPDTFGKFHLVYIPTYDIKWQFKLVFRPCSLYLKSRYKCMNGNNCEKKKITVCNQVMNET